MVFSLMVVILSMHHERGFLFEPGLTGRTSERVIGLFQATVSPSSGWRRALLALGPVS